MCFLNGQLNEERVRLAVQGILETARRGYMLLLGEFFRLVKLEVRRHTANVESAAPLAANLETQVRANLERLYGASLTTLFAQNPALIGGMRIQVGSDVYDGTVISGLLELEKSLGIYNGRSA
jgi:F-type H+-transporting ATPase subunit delta